MLKNSKSRNKVRGLHIGCREGKMIASGGHGVCHRRSYGKCGIYLHELDKEWQRRTRTKLVPFADDLLILTPTEEDARCEHAHLEKVVHEMQLTLNEEKTRVAAAREGFDFLGFSFRR